MKNTLQLIQTRIAAIPEVKYCDEDWGQLDYYSSNAPVKWPCVLIDLQTGQFSNIGNNLQNGDMTIAVNIADLKLAPTSSKVPAGMKAKQWSILELEEKVHKQIHAWCPDHTKAGKLTRISSYKIKRDDGIIQRIVIYNFTFYNI